MSAEIATYKHYEGKKLMPRRQFILRQVVFWILALIWLAVLVASFLEWSKVSLIYQIIILVFLYFLRPEELFSSYKSYKQRWQQENDQIESR